MNPHQLTINPIIKPLETRHPSPPGEFSGAAQVIFHNYGLELESLKDATGKRLDGVVAVVVMLLIWLL